MFLPWDWRGFEEYMLATHLSDVAQGSWDRPNSNLTPGWMTGDDSWKETPRLSVLLQATLCPSY